MTFVIRIPIENFCSFMGQFAVLLILCMFYYEIMSIVAQESFSVVNYGAVGDGETDDAEIYGSIIAPNTPSAWEGIDSSQWLKFDGITGLDISGPGLIDGRGSRWWDQSCKHHPELPALRFSSCNGMNLRNMKVINSPQTHIHILACSEVWIDTINISSPWDSPNTDGIHIHRSQHVTIYNSEIENGDDCISIGDFASHIKINNAYCGFGHGISVGSLGNGPDGPTEAQVEDISVVVARFMNTTNGARIKTWQGGSGYARNISFEQINFANVENPIIIDQNYCKVKGACKEQPTGVQISNVTYRGITGTTITKVAVNFNCSDAVPCTGISLDNIKLDPAISGQQLSSSCNNAYGWTNGVVQPSSCLESKSL
ncbi:hypothetical protein NE237_032168 [Protea cynaroides]|uniref:Polygalacturonase n=1 Tax=Protea cynaroides TaxID=273540 RepID=A0A9Q0L3I0_9MAGN|nr:hypothetical protein NE237_032168 [Protea cynaroides]